MCNSVWALALLCALATCAHADDNKTVLAKFELVSPAFKANDDMPQKYTCQGGDINPPLEFKNIPPKTKSLAVTVENPDAPEGNWTHWGVYNIPVRTTVLSENMTPQYQVLNDFGKYNYSGPCPTDEQQHHYVFKAYAIDGILPVNEGMTVNDLVKLAGKRAIGKAELTVVYQKLAL